MEKHKEIEVKVSPNSSSLAYYKIEWRYKRKRFNFLNPWKTIVEVWDGAYLNYDQPVLFQSFEGAVEYANKIKKDPSLIDKHYEEQDKIYNDAKERRLKERAERNRSIKI